MNSPVNVASHLSRMAEAEPDRPAIHYPTRRGYETLTFRELNAFSDRLAHGLASVGIVRGTRTALMVPPSPEFFALTFALFKIAAVPVLIDPGMGVKNLGKCLAEAAPEAFVGVAKAHLARRILGWARRSIRTTVNVGRRRFLCTRSTGEWLREGEAPAEPHFPARREPRPLGNETCPYPTPPVTADDPAAILFTSGSTGIAKGAEYTHGIFAAQVEMLRTTYGIEPGEIDFCTFPLFALFGPALGMTCVVPKMDFSRPITIDPERAANTIRRFGVTNFFGSPAVVRRFADSSVNPMSLVTVKRALSAGAPVPADSLKRFAEKLPTSAEIFTPYGATEALPVASIGSREILEETRFLTDQGKGVCVGKPVAGVTVYVVPITDDAIPEWDESTCLPPGEIGEFVVRGPIVTKAYFRRPEQTRLAKIRDPRTGETLHRMGDVGYLDDRGRLWYCGRKSHRVVTPTGTLYTEMVESVFNQYGCVLRSALVGVQRSGIIYPVVWIETFSTAFYTMTWEQIQVGLRDLGSRYEHTRNIKTFLYMTKPLPVDIRHNSKIFREKLAVWADKKLGPKWNPGMSTGETARIG